MPLLSIDDIYSILAGGGFILRCRKLCVLKYQSFHF
jgi:hypothetical protein